MALAVATKLGPYEILSPLGAGGMGEVYRARDTRLGREVAIKVLPAGLTQDPERLRRFAQEARYAAAVRHENVVTIFAVRHVSGGVGKRIVASGPTPSPKMSWSFAGSSPSR